MVIKDLPLVDDGDIDRTPCHLSYRSNRSTLDGLALMV
jgi:hypothetical protein